MVFKISGNKGQELLRDAKQMRLALQLPQLTAWRQFPKEKNVDQREETQEEFSKLPDLMRGVRVQRDQVSYSSLKNASEENAAQRVP